MATDVVVIVPIEPPVGHVVDPQIRQTQAAYVHGPLMQAFHEFEAYVGRGLTLGSADNRPRIGGQTWPPTTDYQGARFFRNRASLAQRRSLASITLATHLELSGLTWRVLDPGIKEIRWWRKQLDLMRKDPPKSIAVCTTFIICAPWLRLLLSVIREALPSTKILVGGYFYAVNIQQFLALDADVFCVGEGETRLPRTVKALFGQGDLEQIRGLYFRRPDGRLHYTGRVEPLDLNRIPRVNWNLVDRIEPRLDMKRDSVATWVETQRGCPFKCEFCDFRTIQLPNAMTVDAAVEAILAAAAATHGAVRLTDATATFPHPRWQAIMQGLIDRGGSPAPMWCFGRVTDINEQSAELMGKAGLRHIFVGQESGDQRILQAMKKGTNVKHVPPAIAAMGRHGINATFAFIHGFPGEDETSLQATRSMIAGLNNGHERQPVVLQYLLNVLAVFDLSPVSHTAEMQGVDHFMGYDEARFSSQRACEEALNTMVAVSRIPHAPVYMYLPGAYPSNWEELYVFSPHRYEIFHWMKAIERGVGILLERIVDGKPPNWSELKRAKESILSKYDRISWLQSRLARGTAKMKSRVLKRLVSEWTCESKGSVGLATRMLLAFTALSDTGKLRYAWQSFRSGSYPDANRSAFTTAITESPPDEQNQLVQLADAFREETLGAEQRQRQIREAQAIAHSGR